MLLIHGGFHANGFCWSSCRICTMDVSFLHTDILCICQNLKYYLILQFSPHFLFLGTFGRISLGNVKKTAIIIACSWSDIGIYKFLALDLRLPSCNFRISNLSPSRLILYLCGLCDVTANGCLFIYSTNGSNFTHLWCMLKSGSTPCGADGFIFRR